MVGKLTNGVVSTPVLVGRAQNGSTQAFAQLYERFVNHIFRFVFFKVGNHDLAQDICHEVFLKAWKNLDSVRAESFQPWLYQIARHNVYDYYRTRKQHVTIPADFQDSHFVSPYEILHTKIEADKIVKLISSLKPEYQDVIILRIMRQLSVKETAAYLDITPQNVRVKTFRALKKLKSLYEQK